MISDTGKISISVRGLVEFILRSGDIDLRRGSGGGMEAMLEGPGYTGPYRARQAPITRPRFP